MAASHPDRSAPRSCAAFYEMADQQPSDFHRELRERYAANLKAQKRPH